jgi:hypothetical protein
MLHAARERCSLLLVLVVAACAGPGNAPAGNASDTAGATAARAPDRQADDAPTPNLARRADPRPPWSGDPGIGLLRFSWHEDRPRDASADTIRVRVDADAASPVLARFIYNFGAATRPDTTWGWTIEALESGLVANDVEFEYEENGLPIDSIAGDWLRVIWATTEAGEPRTGWTRLRPDTEVHLWPDLLRENNLFFLDPGDIAFHNAPGGAAVEIALAPAPGTDPWDYTMVADSIDGRWLRVRLVTPSNYCADPANPAEHVAWIEFLDARGRPRVFYHSRGC